MSHDIPDGMSHDIENIAAPACIHVKGPPGHHRRHHRETTRRRSRPTYGVSRSWLYELLARYRTEGDTALEPKKKPKSSYIRFQATMPNETWQSDFTHYPLTDTATFPKGIEIITWLDDCTRYALHISAHHRITTPIVKATFRKTAGQHSIPASTLTDNGMVYTVRLDGIGRNGFEQQLRDWHVHQMNSRPN